MKPPSGGPITGPISAGTLTYDIALTRSDFSTVRSSTSGPTGGPAADRDEHRQAQQIAGKRHIAAQRAFVERARDRRQCGGDHRRIEVLHEHRASDDQRHQDWAGPAYGHRLIYSPYRIR